MDNKEPIMLDETGKAIVSALQSNGVVLNKIAGSGTNIPALSVPTVEPSYADIPILFFENALPQTKTAEVMRFRYVSHSLTFDGYVETKAQGTSSMSYPKKNQTIKLYKDGSKSKKAKINFKDWGEQTKFCLKANWIDITHARNIVSAQIWSDVVKSRADYEALPEALRSSPNQGAIDGFPVLLYADGVYQGRYTLNIPKDGWMANMDKNDENQCILCGENYESGLFRKEALIDTTDWSDELHDVCPENIKERWNEIINFVQTSSDEEFKAKLDDYFFVDSLIDYLVYGVASCGLDAFGKNQIYMTYDGQKWIASMYDMDSTWGLIWSGAYTLESTYARDRFEDSVGDDRPGNLLYIRLAKLFKDELRARWEELKVGPLSYGNIMSKFEQFIKIVPPYIVEEDYAETTGEGKFTEIPSKEANTIYQIRTFVKERQTYTDNYMETLE